METLPGGRRGRDEAGPDLGKVFAVVGELDLGVAAGQRGNRALYRVVQLNSTPDIEVLFHRSLTVLNITSLKQHICIILQFPVLNPVRPPWTVPSTLR